MAATDVGTGEGTATAPRKKLSSIGEVEIEFGDNRNRSFAWGPTMEVLRGHWLRENLRGDEVVEELENIPNVPGMRIRLDCARGKSVIYDPLSLPEHATIKDRLVAIIKAKWNQTQGPAKTVEREKMDQDDVKSWLYLMARLVAAKRAKVTKGTIPPPEDVYDMEGRTRIQYFNSSARACKFREEWDAYLDRLLTGGRDGL